MDVLRRGPKRRDWIEPRNRPRYRRNLEHSPRHDILPDTCRGNEAPGPETSRQTCADCSGRRTGPERPQRDQTSHVRSRASRRVSQRSQTVQKAERLRNQERGSTIDCKRRFRAGRILHDVTSFRGNTLAAGKVEALTPTSPPAQLNPPEKSGSDKMPGITERLLYRVAKRWIAGYTLEDAIRVAHNANDRKLSVILNRLGEHTPDEKLIQGYTEEYLKLLDQIQEGKIDGTISVKPSQLGLAGNSSLYNANLLRIIERAETYDAFVWIDMENSPYTEGTLKAYKEILPGHQQLGVCLQANMKRTESDLKDLISRGGIIRLVKGAYPETGELVY